jgi:hypothetical protein
MKALAWLLLGCAVATGCGTDPADVEGNYTIALTNRDNGCMFTNYTVGETAASIPVVATQDSANLTMTVNGVAAIYLNAVLGTNTYRGDVDGSDFRVEALGTVARTSGNCTYTINSVIDGSLSGDALTGRIEYRAADNGNPDCSPIHGCLTFQDFNGTRPPT